MLLETLGRKALTVCVRAVAIVAVLAVSTPAAAQGPPYSFEVLKYPDAKSTLAYGVNNAGVIVGTFTDQASIAHGFRYEQGTYTVIDFPGATHTHVLGINHIGQIVGSHSFDGVNGPWHSFVYLNGQHTQFDFPGWESDGRGINAAGSIVGVYNAGGQQPTQGFIRTGTDTYTTLNYQGALYTYLWGINDAGTITGSYIAQNDPLFVDHGFVYSNGVFTRIDYPGAFETTVIGINNLEDVIGSYVLGNSVYSFVYSPGRFRAFGVPNATNTRAMAINDARQVVGSYFSAECPSGCGFLARPTTGLPRCDQSFGMTYTGTALNLNFSLATTGSTTWETWIFSQSAALRLWSLPLGTTPRTPVFNVPIPNFRPSGKVFGLSGLSVPGVGMICADYSLIDTGGTQ